MIRLLLGLILMTAASTAPASAASLRDMTWDARPLLVFAPDRSAAATEQLEAIRFHAHGVADRKMAVYQIDPDGVIPMFRAPAIEDSAEALRERFGVAHDAFAVVLLGLDGFAKLTEREPVSAERLFDLIDGMPMRQRELRQRES